MWPRIPSHHRVDCVKSDDERDHYSSRMKIRLIFEGFLCARHCSEQFTPINAFNAHTTITPYVKLFISDGQTTGELTLQEMAKKYGCRNQSPADLFQSSTTPTHSPARTFLGFHHRFMLSSFQRMPSSARLSGLWPEPHSGLRPELRPWHGHQSRTL